MGNSRVIMIQYKRWSVLDGGAWDTDESHQPRYLHVYSKICRILYLPQHQTPTEHKSEDRQRRISGNPYTKTKLLLYIRIYTLARLLKHSKKVPLSTWAATKNISPYPRNFSRNHASILPHPRHSPQSHALDHLFLISLLLLVDHDDGS
jgi:hypothetical protein